MDALLLDLLNYSRFARDEVPPELVDLDSLVPELLAVVEREVREHNVNVEIASPLGKVYAHPATLKQILTNLVGNSLKFITPERAPILRIFTAEQDGHLRICVEDNGIGIAEEHYEKIFGLFQRLHDSEKYPGTGIGLALVRKGAERMGGRVGVESKLGEGSCFWVALPSNHSGEE
jgi:signal transduction histidine kinase